MRRIAGSGYALFLAGALWLGVSACSKTAPAVAQAQAGDPANGNLAAAGQAPDQTPANTAPAAGYAQSQTYAPAPSQSLPPQEDYTPPPAGNSYADTSYDASYDQPVYAAEPPPPLPEYNQPPCPGDDYIWTPGYWGWENSGYYWVPGVWVTAPYIDALWTPPYWGFVNGRYLWHRGYWGPHIGFYGGIDYGFGYTGHGYYGAYWNNGSVYYNRSVTNVDVARVKNVYNYSVPAVSHTRISYNGGRGGINARPLPAEQVALREPHERPVAAQVQHIRQAAGNRAQFAAVNRGRPQTVAAATPLATSYRNPAPRPAAVAQALARPTPAARPGSEARPNIEARAPGGRGQVQPGARPGAPAAAPQPSQRAEANQPNRPGRPAPENRIVGRQPQAAPVPAARQPFQENRGAPQQAPAARQPFPQGRAAAPVTRQPVPENRPPASQAQRFGARPTPQAVARPAPAPRQEARPTPQAVARPAPAPRQEVRPAPQAVARPAPAPRPAARPAPPAARPAPQPAARPAPAPHPEGNKEKR
jgi:hypothetical protein